VATTFRLTEHHTAGGMSRWLPWLAELQPGMFAEIDPVLAREHGIEDGGWMTIVTPRAEIEAVAKVTQRMRPLKIDGRVVHQVALPWHWGFGGPQTGDAANDLITLSGDPNTSIQESKAFVCDVRAGRRSAGPARLAGVHDAPAHVAINEDHVAEEQPSS
jgi:formate dehydrogenase major subunit